MPRLAPVTLALAVVAALFFATLPTPVLPVDGGELSAVARHLGIAHPTGYPLWTPLAHLVSMVPIGPTFAWRLALFSALCGVGALALLAPLFAAGAPRAAGPLGGLLVPALILLAASLSSFLSIARTAEVYALSLLFFVLILRIAHEAGEGRMAPERGMLLCAYLLGLGSGVHMTLLLAVPGLLYLAWRARLPSTVWARAVPLAVLGRTVYAFLPIRSSGDPPLDWGNPVTLHALLAHAFAWQYHVWMFESLDSAMKNLAAFGLEAWHSFFLLLLLVPFGLLRLRRTAPRALVASLLIFVVYLAYSAGYSIHDIAIYFLPAQLLIVFWIGAGAGEVIDRLAAARAAGARAGDRRAAPRSSPGAARGVSRASSIGRAAAVLFPALIVVPAALSWKSHARRERDEAAVAESFAREVLGSLPPRAIVLSRFWDLLVSPSLYLQWVEGYRTDVTVIDQENCRRSWYVPQIARTAPDLARAARAESAEFLRLLEPFERGKPFDREHLQGAYERMIWAYLEADTTRPLFATIDIEPALVHPYRSDPHGLVMRLLRSGDPLPPPYRGALPTWSPRVLSGAGEYGGMAAEMAGEMAAAAAQRALDAGDADLARARLAQADSLGRGERPRAQRVRALLAGG